MRQKYTYSCGAACIYILEGAVAASNDLYEGHALTSEEEIMRLCGAKPGVGIGNEDLVKGVKENSILSSRLGVVGEGVYDGGVGIINIKNSRSGGGHYVIVLKMGKMVSLIDPIVGEVEQKHISEIDWESGDGRKQWALNMKMGTDEKTKVIKFLMGMKSDRVLHIVTESGNNIEQMDDTSVSVMENITAYRGVLRLGALEVIAGDVVLIVIDYKNIAKYIAGLQILSVFEGNEGVRFINSPRAMCHSNPRLIMDCIFGMKGYYIGNNENAKNIDYYNKKNSPGILHETNELMVGSSAKISTVKQIIKSESRVVFYNGKVEEISHKIKDKKSETLNPKSQLWFGDSDCRFDNTLENELKIIINYMAREGVVLFEVIIINKSHVSEINYTGNIDIEGDSNCVELIKKELFNISL